MDPKVKLLTVPAFLVCSLVIMVHGQCHSLYGPSGETVCRQVNDYDGPQWVTCLSDSYIKESSDGKHACSNFGFIRYCYYQCMLEEFGQEEGPVYDDCACGNKTTTQTAPTTTPSTLSTNASLPNSCFSPSGTNCNWYKQCLERRHPCTPNHYNGYAVEYSEKVCKLYVEQKSKFSDIGQKWLNAVRKCLEVKLVPVLRPYIKTYCEQIRDKAFNTHAPCYMEPYPGEPSICDLSLTDWAKFFWTIKDSFDDSTIPSLKNLIDVTRKCSNNVLENVLNFQDGSTESGMGLIKIMVYRIIGKTSDSTEYDDLADSIATQLALNQRWEEKSLAWFSFVVNDDGAKEFDINILLGSKAKYVLDSSSGPEAEMNKTLNELADAFDENRISLKVDVFMRATKFAICLDFDCNNTYREVEGIKSYTSATRSFQYGFATLIFSLSSIMLS